MTKKCICFSRVSGSRQDLTAQQKEVYKAALKEYNKSEILEVSGKESAIKLKEEERQTLNEMKQLVEEHPSIESVYFYAVDRCARRMNIVLSVAKWAEDNKINLVFLNPYPIATMINKGGERIKNPMTEMILAMMGFAAEMEMKIKIERKIDKTKEMKDNNEVIGKLIFGYRNKNKHADYCPIKAPIVKWIFKSYNEDGLSLTKIFDKGVELGYWDNLQIKSSKASRIRQILMNYAYSSEPTKSGFVYPKLIEKEEIDKAIYLMSKAQSKAKTQSKVIALAKGKIKSLECGYSMLYDGNHLKYFVKSDKAGKLYSASLNIIDFFVWKEASRIKWNILANKDNSTKQTVGEEIDAIDDRIYNIQQIIDKEINERFDKAYKAFTLSHGRVSNEDYEKEVIAINKEEKKYKVQIESLQQRKVELQAVLNELNNSDREKIDPYTIMEITDHQHQKEITDEVIDRIEVQRTELGQEVFIYNKYETEPQRFLNKTKTNHIELYWIINNELDAIDISGEYKPRYRRTNK